jgi:hypothetical protein
MVSVLALATVLAQAPNAGPTPMSVTPVEARLFSASSDPAKVTSCSAQRKVYAGPFTIISVSVSVINSGKKTIDVLGVAIVPFDAFNKPSGEGGINLLPHLNLAPGQTYTDTNLTDGAQSLPQTYVIHCYVANIRFADDTTWSWTDSLKK